MLYQSKEYIIKSKYSIKEYLNVLCAFIVLTSLLCLSSVSMAAKEWVGCPVDNNYNNINSTTLNGKIGYVHLPCQPIQLQTDTFQLYGYSCTGKFNLHQASAICSSLVSNGGGAVLAWTSLSWPFAALSNGTYHTCMKGSFDKCGDNYDDIWVKTVSAAVTMNWACMLPTFQPDAGGG